LAFYVSFLVVTLTEYDVICVFQSKRWSRPRTKPGPIVSTLLTISSSCTIRLTMRTMAVFPTC